MKNFPFKGMNPPLKLSGFQSPNVNPTVVDSNINDSRSRNNATICLQIKPRQNIFTNPRTQLFGKTPILRIPIYRRSTSPWAMSLIALIAWGRILNVNISTSMKLKTKCPWISSQVYTECEPFIIKIFLYPISFSCLFKETVPGDLISDLTPWNTSKS
jgi:hypothetical protein